MQNSARAAAAARGAGVRPPTEITRRHFFSTAPSCMSSATVERPAPIARQRACGAQRRKNQCHPHVPKPLKPVVGSASLSSSLSHRAARRRCKPANTQSERLAPPASPRSPLVPSYLRDWYLTFFSLVVSQRQPERQRQRLRRLLQRQLQRCVAGSWLAKHPRA